VTTPPKTQTVIAIFTKYFDLHQFLNNLVFFTKSLLLTSTFIELLLLRSLQHLATKDKSTFDKKEVFIKKQAENPVASAQG
jgi:hypothetical protein